MPRYRPWREPSISASTRQTLNPANVCGMNRRNQPPVHPFAPVLLALVGVVVLGIAYLGFGVGKDAFEYLVAALAVFAIPVVIVFGITGLVMGIRRLFRRTK
jgi:hypothetical protein